MQFKQCQIEQARAEYVKEKEEVDLVMQRLIEDENRQAKSSRSYSLTFQEDAEEVVQSICQLLRDE